MIDVERLDLPLLEKLHRRATTNHDLCKASVKTIVGFVIKVHTEDGEVANALNACGLSY